MQDDTLLTNSNALLEGHGSRHHFSCKPEINTKGDSEGDDRWEGKTKFNQTWLNKDRERTSRRARSWSRCTTMVPVLVPTMGGAAAGRRL